MPGDTPAPDDASTKVEPTTTNPQVASNATPDPSASSDGLDGLTAGQTIVPGDTPAPDVPVSVMDQPAMPSATAPLPVTTTDNAEPVPLPVSSLKPHKKKGMLVGLIIGAVVVLGGGAAATSYYIQSRPANILKHAVTNVFDTTKAKTMQFSGALEFKGGGSGPAINVTYEGQMDNATNAFDFTGKLDALVTNITFDLRSTDGKTVYLKVGGLDGLATLLGGSETSMFTDIYGPIITTLNDQWLEINDSLVKQVTGTSFQNDKVSDTDRQKLADGYAKHPFVVVKEVLPNESIKGADSYHYKLVIDKAKLKEFINEIKEINLGGVTLTQEQLEDFQDSIPASEFEKQPIEVWINKSTKMINQVVLKMVDGESSANLRFTVDSYNKPVEVEKPAGAKSLLEILGSFYSGGGTGSDLSLPALESGLSL